MVNNKHSKKVAALAFGLTLVLVALLATAWAHRPRDLCAPWSLAPVRVESAPAGAEVHVDGRAMGTTPLALKLCRGQQHNIRVSHPDHVSWEWNGVLSAPLVLDARLLPR